MKKALIIAGGFVALVVVAALVIPSFLNWNQYKAQIENAIEAATGRDVSIDGDIALTVLPAPAFSVEKLSLANMAGGKASHMVTLDALDVRIRLLPLLRGNVDVDKIVLVAPRINLEVLSDGRRNWDFAGDETTPPGKAGTGKAGTGKAGTGIAADVRVNRFVIENGEVVYRDDTTGALEKVEALNAVISAETLDGPYKIKGDMVARATPFAFAASVGKIGNGKIPVSLDLTLSGGSADAAFRGLVDVNQPRSAEGTFKVHATDAGALVETISRAATGQATVVPIHQPLKFESAFVGSATSFHTTAMTLGLGSSNADGHIKVSWDGAPRFDVALAFGALDADELLAAASQSRAQSAAKTEPFVLPDPATLLPGDISGKFVLSAEALRYRKRVMRQAQLSVSAEKGKLDIDQLHALLPGGAEVKLAGRLADTAQGARFDGKIDATANNLSGLLDWLDVTPTGLEPGRLSSFAVDGGVYLTKEEIGITKALVRLDAANFKGAAAFRPGATPVIRLNGALDRLDLDYYLPKGVKCLGSGKEGDKPDLLAAVNADVILTIGRLTCPETRIDGLVVDASLSNGVLTLRKFSATQAAGLKLALSGQVKDLETTPSFDLTVDAGGPSLGEVEQLFPGILPKPAVQLGAVGFSGKIAGTPLKLTTEGTLDLGGTTLSGRADVAFNGEARKKGGDASALKSLDTGFTLKAASLAQFIEQWDLPLTPPPTRDDRPLEVGGSLTGSMAAMNVDLKGRIATAGFDVKGTMRNVDTTPTYDLAVDLDGKDLTAFVRGLGIDFEPADPTLGPIKMNAALSGGAESLLLKIPSSQIGPVVFNGATTMAFTGDRPTITGDIRAGDVPLDRFMAPPPKDTRKQDGAHQWSRAPFNNDWLKTFDANFRVRANAVTLNDYRFEQPKFTVAVSGGVLEVRDLTGKLFGGDVALAMTYGGATPPGLSLTMSLTDGSLEKALGTAFGVTAITGSVGFKSKLSSVGASPYDLVRGLTGATQVSLGKGIVRGIDLPKLSQNMKAMNSVEAFGRVLGSALSGGSTKHEGFDTTVTTEGGAFSLNDLVIQLDAGKALLGGRVDLFKWLVDARGRLQLTDQPLAPPIGVDIAGGLSAPTVSYQTREIKSYMAAEISKALLNKATGGGLDQLLGIPKKQEAPTTEGAPGGAQPQSVPAPATPAPANEQPARQDPAMQLFKGILKSLEKKDQQKPQ